MAARNMPNSLLLATTIAALPLMVGCGLAARGQNVSGVQAYQQGNYQVAMQRFQYAQQADPRNPDGYYNQAALLHNQGIKTGDKVALAQAESMYNTCLSMNPNHVDCYRGLAVLLTETGRQPQAFELLTRWAGANPTSADARVELARLSEEIGDQRNAENYLTDALKIDSGNWRALAAMGRRRELQGDLAAAVQNYQWAAQRNPSATQLATKVQELNTRIAQNRLSTGNTSASSATPGGALPNTTANIPPGGFNWTNPVKPNAIIANPIAPLGTRSATAPNRDIRY